MTESEKAKVNERIEALLNRAGQSMDGREVDANCIAARYYDAARERIGIRRSRRAGVVYIAIANEALMLMAADLAETAEQLDVMETALHNALGEREALKAQMREVDDDCKYCIHAEETKGCPIECQECETPCICMTQCTNGSCYEWAGVPEEKDGDDDGQS